MNADKIASARERVFGLFPAAPAQAQTGRAFLSRRLVGPVLAAYYPMPLSDLNDPLYTDPADSRKAAKLQRLKRRGKGPPKKGMGKRAQRRNK